jgi:hypothetical protein
MKQNIVKGDMAIIAGNGASANANEAQVDSQNFSRQLRALGQALERFSFSAFDLELRSGIYLVAGSVIATESVKFSFSGFVRALLRGSSAQAVVMCSDGQVDLRFSPEEIERFEECGKVRRQDSSKMPDPYSISQILRGAGAFLDNRDGATLTRVSLKSQWVTVSYQTPEGRLEQSQQDLEYFYNYWVKMYLRRSNRAKLPPPNDPTVLVTWQGIKRAPGISNPRR